MGARLRRPAALSAGDLVTAGWTPASDRNVTLATNARLLGSGRRINQRTDAAVRGVGFWPCEAPPELETAPL